MGFFKDLGETVKGRLNPKTIASEAFDGLVNRLSHGSAEFAHGLLTGNTAYVPYGQDNMPVAAPEPEPEAPATPSLDESYQAQVAFNAMGGPTQKPQSPGL